MQCQVCILGRWDAIEIVLLPVQKGK